MSNTIEKLIYDEHAVCTWQKLNAKLPFSGVDLGCINRKTESLDNEIIIFGGWN